LRDLVCYCRSRGCKGRERMNGTCRKGHLLYTLCCR
nr:cryptdin-1 [mice, intestinal epithelium, Peptide Partial, 35 aa] [Mus sp.]prf//1813205A cryptdin 1 [Mus musculus]